MSHHLAITRRRYRCALGFSVSRRQALNGYQQLRAQDTLPFFSAVLPLIIGNHPQLRGHLNTTLDYCKNLHTPAAP